MWSDGYGPYHGQALPARTHVELAAVAAPAATAELIGGSGEKKTLRMVAQYAQACNLFGGPDVVHKLDACCASRCDEVVATTTTSKRR